MCARVREYVCVSVSQSASFASSAIDSIKTVARPSSDGQNRAANSVNLCFSCCRWRPPGKLLADMQRILRGDLRRGGRTANCARSRRSQLASAKVARLGRQQQQQQQQRLRMRVQMGGRDVCSELSGEEFCQVVISGVALKRLPSWFLSRGAASGATRLLSCGGRAVSVVMITIISFAFVSATLDTGPGSFSSGCERLSISPRRWYRKQRQGKAKVGPSSLDLGQFVSRARERESEEQILLSDSYIFPLSWRPLPHFRLTCQVCQLRSEAISERVVCPRRRFVTLLLLLLDGVKVGDYCFLL